MTTVLRFILAIFLYDQHFVLHKMCKWFRHALEHAFTCERKHGTSAPNLSQEGIGHKPTVVYVVVDLLHSIHNLCVWEKLGGTEEG